MLRVNPGNKTTLVFPAIELASVFFEDVLFCPGPIVFTGSCHSEERNVSSALLAT